MLLDSVCKESCLIAWEQCILLLGYWILFLTWPTGSKVAGRIRITISPAHPKNVQVTLTMPLSKLQLATAWPKMASCKKTLYPVDCQLNWLLSLRMSLVHVVHNKILFQINCSNVFHLSFYFFCPEISYWQSYGSWQIQGGCSEKYLENCDPLLSHKYCFTQRAKEVGWG